MTKIQKISKVITRLCVVALIALPVAQIIGWIFFDDILGGFIVRGFNPSHIPLYKLPISEITAATKVLGFFASMIPTGIYMLAIYFIYKLFRLYSSGEIFSKLNTNYIRKIGYVILIGQIVNLIYEPIMSVILTMNNPVGQRMLTIQLRGTNLGVAVIAIMIIVVSWIMDEGRKLKEEEALTV